MTFDNTEFLKMKKEIDFYDRTLCLYLDVRIDTVRSYSCGRLPVPENRMARMKEILEDVRKIRKG